MRGNAWTVVAIVVLAMASSASASQVVAGGGGPSAPRALGVVGEELFSGNITVCDTTEARNDQAEVVLSDGFMPDDDWRTVSVEYSVGPTGLVSWTSAEPIEILVIKQGAGGVAYKFDPFQSSGENQSKFSDGSNATGVSHTVGCTRDADEPKAVLAVQKTADASWTRERDGWNVTKRGELTTAPSKDGNGLITWDVEWTKGEQVDEHEVTGTITIENTGNAVALNVTVDDTLDADADFVLDCGSWTPGSDLAAGATVNCTYSVLLDAPVDGTNEVTVDAANAESATASDGYDFPSEPELVEGSAPDAVYVVDERFDYRFGPTSTGGSKQLTEGVTCAGGTFTNTVELREVGEGVPGDVIDDATAQVVVNAVDCSTTPPPTTPPPTVSQTPQIDVQVIKDATPQLTLGASGTAEITYNVVVKNNGPNTANDVVFADAAPSGVEFVAGTLTQGPVIAGGVPCSLTVSVLSCANLGDFGPGVQTVLSWKATVRTTGTFVNTGTATGTGTDTNPGNNTDDATTVVVAAPVVQPPVVKPPVAKPPVAKPKPAAICLKLAVRGTKMVSQGQRSAVAFKVTRAGRPVAGAAVVLRGAGIYRVVKTNKQGLAIAGVTPARAGIVTATLSPKQVGCNSARVGVVGVFEPPVTG